MMEPRATIWKSLKWTIWKSLKWTQVQYDSISRESTNERQALTQFTKVIVNQTTKFDITEPHDLKRRGLNWGCLKDLALILKLPRSPESNSQLNSKDL